MSKNIAAIALTLTIAATIVVSPIAFAHDPPWEIATFAFVVAAPDPIGVGQTGTIHMWLDKFPPTAFWKYGDRYEGFTLEITNPDGDVETLGPFTSDDIGGAHVMYTPDTVGTYHLKFSYPGQTLEGKNPPVSNPSSVNDTMLPSNAQCDWIVQAEAVESRPATPLPTNQYWTRPISGLNPEWACIAGDSLGFNPEQTTWNEYTLAPESSHIMWTKPLAFAGVVGGAQAEYDWNYYTGLSYETKFAGIGASIIIMNGRLYYPLPLGTAGSGGGTTCVDLRTGETIWTVKDLRSLSFGLNYDYVSPNEFGVKPYLVSAPGGMMGPATGNFQAYDPFSGELLFTIANYTGGYNTLGPHGELITYILNGRNSWLGKWNFSKCVLHYMSNAWMWRPQGRTMDFKYGIEWNVTTSTYKEPGNQGIYAVDVPTGVILASTKTGSSPLPWIMEIGYSIEDGRELWHVNRTAPFEGGMIGWQTLQGGVRDGVFTEWYQEKMIWYGYDITTGKRIWGPTEPYKKAWGMYGWQSRKAYGLHLANDFSGIMHAYDLKTGENVWNYDAGAAGWDTPYGIYPSEMPIVEADGKIYLTHGHGYSPPIFKGATLTCLNATDGTEMWKIQSFNNRAGMAIADGYIATYNIYDGLVYSFGKGPSVTTVDAPMTGITLGDSLVIRGSVVDTCAGAQKLVAEGKFASVAAVSDDSQQQWMEYLYMQQPCPANATGVDVKLDIYDPNGNWFNIGTATSSASGMYSQEFTPEVPGKYTIIATFEGSKSYGPSYAETAIYVEDAPAATPAPTPEPESIADMYFMPMSIGILVAIIVAVVVLFLLLRKR